MCRFCERHVEFGYEVDCLSIRKLSKYNVNVYTGICSFIDLDTNELVMYAVADNKYTKPLHTDAAFDIFYCPKCGRKLGEK